MLESLRTKISCEITHSHSKIPSSQCSSRPEYLTEQRKNGKILSWLKCTYISPLEFPLTKLLHRKLPQSDLEMVRPTSFKGRFLPGHKKMVDNMRAKGVNFLKPIQTEALSHAPYSKNDAYKFRACMNAYEISYKKWKKYVLDELKSFIRLIDKKEATFHCPYCDVAFYTRLVLITTSFC